MCYLINAYIKNTKKEDIKKSSLPFSLCSVGELDSNGKNLFKKFGLDLNYISIFVTNNGHCSCDLYSSGSPSLLEDRKKELLKSIKRKKGKERANRDKNEQELQEVQTRIDNGEIYLKKKNSGINSSIINWAIQYKSLEPILLVYWADDHIAYDYKLVKESKLRDLQTTFPENTLIQLRK